MGWSKLAAVDPYEHHRLWGSEKYSLNGMLLKQAAMPDRIMLGVDTSLEVYSDRIIGEWQRAVDTVRADFPVVQGGAMDGAWFANLPDDGFIQFAQAVANEMKYEMKVTGARITRYTNVSSGYPCHLLTAVEVVHEPSQRVLLYGQQGTRRRVDDEYLEDFGVDPRRVFRRIPRR